MGPVDERHLGHLHGGFLPASDHREGGQLSQRKLPIYLHDAVDEGPASDRRGEEAVNALLAA